MSALSRSRSAALLLALAALALCESAAAQSGRRVRGARPVEPPPAPIITPKTETGPPNRRNLPDLPLAVAGRIGPKVTRARAEVIYNHFASRLGEFMKVTSHGLAKRDEAVRRARDEGQRYVVFLELMFEPFRDGRIVFSSPDIVVDYSVIDAATGDSKTKGAIYYRPNGGDGAVKITPEAAGEEAAERVLDWLSLPTNLAR